ncbi:MAG: sensor histidine kinase [Micropruina sp.]|uniref:sensor histidine kinase n=1 Tax=Micropruina sp. TaxID=2737536 RepID=UPI0039E58209
MRRHLGAPTVAWTIAAAGLIVALGSLLVEPVAAGTVNFHHVIVAVIALPLGARVASHAPRNHFGWWLLAAGALAALAAGFGLARSGVGGWVGNWVWFPGYAILALSGVLFPDGRLPSRRWRVPLAVIGAGLLIGLVGIAVFQARYLPTGAAVPMTWDVVASWIGLAALLLAAVLAPVAIGLKVRRAGPGERGALLWGVASAALVVVALALEAGGVSLAGVLAILAFPLATVVAIVRYGLYDIDTVVHRAMLYGTLALAVMGIYAALTAVVADVAGAQLAPIAAALAAVAVLPVRDSLQRAIDRRLYGDSGRPYELLTSLARGVGMALTPGEMLTAVVDRVAEGLRVPYVAVLLDPSERPERSSGTQRPWPVTTLDLVHRGATIGQLVVQQRAPDEPWLPRERRLLHALALQVAAPAAAVRLIRDLQQARERLVTAREEERRRLRKDLHDGVGPALSGARMQLRAALAALGRTPEESAVRAIEDDLSLASTELRRAIEGLRPPALDRGLPAALAGVVDRHAQGGPPIDLVLPDRLEGVLAAVEVALYRVLDEALSNCVRHAGASRVTAQIRRQDDSLLLTVTDDGRGYSGPRPGGFGTESMRQRCEELGGSFAIEAAAPHGTVVTARFGCGQPG